MPRTKKSKKKPKRMMERLEVSLRGKERAGELSEDAGMTQVQFCTRVIEWFVVQPRTVQAIVLGIYPAKIREPDMARILLRALKAHLRK